MEKILKFIRPYEKTILLWACFLAVFGLVTHSMIDYDFWFHYDCGRYIVEHHQIPTMAIGSWYGLENNLQWISHEWLFGLLVYHLAETVGLNFLPAFAGFWMATLVTLVFAVNIDNLMEAPLKTVLLALFSGIIFMGATVVRPQLILYTFTVLLFLLLDGQRKKPDWKIWLLVPLTITWVNLHGGSYILLFVFYVLMILMDLIAVRVGRLKFRRLDNRVLLTRLAVLLVSVAAVSLNAHGLEMYSYPFTNMADAVMLATITEWAPLNVASINAIFLVIPALYFYFVFQSQEDVDPFELIYVLAFLFLGFKSVRFLIQLNLVCLLCLPRHITFTESGVDKTYFFILPLIVILLTFTCTKSLEGAIKEPFRADTLPSDEVIAAVKELEPERLYNYYDIGGYLLYEQIPVFIDGRADIYSKYNTMDFTNISEGNYSFEYLLSKYDFDAFLVNRRENLCHYLKDQKEDYKLVIEDDNYALLVPLTEDK